MKVWKWDIFIVSFIVFVVVAMILSSAILGGLVWPFVLVFALVLSVGLTFIKGLLKHIGELERRTDVLEERIRLMEKKTAGK